MNPPSQRPDEPLGSGTASARADLLFSAQRRRLFRETDQLFSGLLVFQWFALVAIAILISPGAWSGPGGKMDPHVWAAVFLGGSLVILPAWLTLTVPGATATRHAVAAGQALVGALLIHLTGGRIESHFHVFGSLAFLAVYRDWKVLVTASALVTLDHVLRSVFWPRSLFGVPVASHWRWLEHSGWLVFEVTVLIYSCLRGVREMRAIAERESDLIELHDGIEDLVELRTFELRESEARKATIFESAMDAIVTLDTRGRVVEFNRAAELMFGRPRGEVVGRAGDALIRPPDGSTGDGSDFTRLLQRGSGRELGHRTEVVAARADGSNFPAEVSISAVPGGASALYTAFVRDITERKRAEERLEYQATHDPLTGLPNRARLHAELDEAFRGDDFGRPGLAFLLVDLDRFKEVNDTFGHHYGDLLLQSLGPRLRDALGGIGTVARLGGDEFGVVIRNAGEAEAVRAAEAVLRLVAQPILVRGQALEVGASIGLALAPKHARDAAALLQCADTAMYAAKRSHAGYLIYTGGAAGCTPKRLTMVGELRRGIEQGQLTLHYQPKVDLRTGRACGAEALVRWAHPRDGLLAPSDFLGIAEQTGLIRPLTHWVLNTATLQCSAWHRMGVGLGVAVNLASESLQEPGLVDSVAGLLDCSGAPPGKITLEVTETAMMADPLMAMDVLGRLRGLGVRISIDDFGTGYSSLAYLKDLPIDEVKIDRSFVKNVSTDLQDACIVRSVVELGHNLGLRVVAEGAEDAEAVSVLESLGCDVVQGFYFARPLPPDRVTDWLKASHRVGSTREGS